MPDKIIFFACLVSPNSTTDTTVLHWPSVIILVDMNTFFALVEQFDNPAWIMRFTENRISDDIFALMDFFLKNLHELACISYK